ncbi:MAG: tryptophan synthase subunit beta [Fibrobacter sp.]|nr:tryptophan synthase subunit beta [Fibrobacter sp.]
MTKIIGTYPNARGHFGIYGGQYVGETLMPALIELEKAYAAVQKDQSFWEEYRQVLADYVGRPTSLDFAERLTDHVGGAQIYLKREDQNHTGAHKVNNTVGQILLARRMGKTRVIAETGAGQHGVATATLAARYGLECMVFMGAEDVRRQAPNVQRMKLLGAEVVAVDSGTATLKDAMNEAMRYWAAAVSDTFYVIGTVAGPSPYPQIVRDFQRIIGDEARRQFMQKFDALPDLLVACVGGGSNAMGLFYPFLDDDCAILGIEAGGEGEHTQRHAATLGQGRVGVLHGSKSYMLQDRFGQVVETHSISAGLDYPGVGPEHSLLKDLGRARYESVSDAEALEAFQLLARLEGIIPALESSHALAGAMRTAKTMKSSQRILVNLSGRGDKDLDHALSLINLD